MRSPDSPAVRCPICGGRVPEESKRFLPFCSDRCRLIDLGRWLDEAHAIPCSADDNEDEVIPEAPPVTDDDQTDRRDRRPPIRLPPGWHDA